VWPSASIRPLAYSMLADLVHHVRVELSMPQLIRMVNLYSRSLQDSTLPLTIQTMSAKLLVNLIDSLKRSEGNMVLYWLPRVGIAAVAHVSDQIT